SRIWRVMLRIFSSENADVPGAGSMFLMRVRRSVMAGLQRLERGKGRRRGMDAGLARVLRQVEVNRMELGLQTQPRTMQTYASSGGRDVEDHSDLRRGQLLPGPQSQDLGV